MNKKCTTILLLFACGFILNPKHTYAQTPGFIFEPSAGSAMVFDPNGDGFVSESSLGFSNDGYDVDEFEIPMFPMPTLGSGEPISDLASGPTCGFTDMSFDINGESNYVTIDSMDNVLFRFRLSSAAPNSKGYTVLIDTDGLVGTQDPNYTTENPGFEIAVTLITKSGVYIYDVDGIDDCTIEKKAYSGNSNYQKVSTIVGPCAAQDVFYDFFIPFSDLTTYFGITTSTPIRFVATTNTSASCAFQGSLSDIGGVDDNLYGGCQPCAFEDLANSFPPVPIDSLCSNCSGFPPIYSDCPNVNQPVANGATIINGNSEPNAQVYYKIFNSFGTLISEDSTVADGSGAWISNVISPGINSNDSIVISALTPGKTLTENCDYIIAGAQCTASPLDNGSITVSNKGFCGSAGNALNGAEIRIYKNGVLQNPGSGTPAPIIVAADGSWIWKCNANLGCNAGTSCLTDGVYMITQQISGECESQPTVVCFNTTGTTSTPAINAPLSTTDSNITGTAVIASTIYLYVNGELETTGIANGAGNWSITGVTLNKCDTVMARASIGSLCISAYSSPIVVSESSLDPVLNCEYFYGDVIINGTAVGDANDPVYITVYDVSSGTPIADTTYLTAFNNWTHTLSQPLDIGDSIKVKILPTCGELSNYSNVCIIPDTIQRPFLDCSLNYSSGDTIISGTHPTNGVNIHVFIDGDSLGTTIVISGSWSLIDSTNSLYTGAVLSSQADDGVSVSNLSNTCVVNCKLPDNSFTLSYPGDDIIQGNTTVAYLSGSETGVFYELFDVENNVPVGTTTFGTNSPLALGTFSLVDTTIIIVRAFKLPPVCEVFINDTILINVYLPVVNAMTDTVIVNSYDTIIIPAINNDVFIHTSPDYSSLNILTGFGPFNGSAVVDTLSGEIKYQANNGFTGSDSLLYAICDTNGFCDTAMLAINVTIVNSFPLASNDTILLNEDVAILIDVQSNDSDVDGDTLTTTILSGPSNGAALVVNGDSITYTPNANFNGTDTLVYVISDGNGGTDTATVVITVNPVNDAPVVVDDSTTTNEDTPVTVNVQANDSDLDGDTLITTILSGPSNGAAVVVNGDSISYTPAPNFHGTDTIIYVISDGNGGTGSATVVITVDPVNDPPVAVDDSATTNEDTPVTVNIQTNDSDVDGDTLTTTILSGPSNGAAVVVNGDSITYTPAPNFHGTDTIVYVISDGNGGTGSATVVITVDPVNDPPVAVDDSATTNEDTPVTVNVQANDSDIDGNTLITTILSGPSNGGAAVVNGDSITYTPNPNFNGTDTIVYVISDGNGGTGLATVVITIDPVNDPPVAVDDSATTNEDTPVTVNVQTNDSDVDGDTLTTTILSGPSNGAALVVNGDSISYTPNPNFYGTDTIVHVISDGNGGTDTATVVITVDSVNDPPLAVDDNITTNEDTPVTVDVQVNDSDLDGDTLTTTILSGPSNGGVVVVNGDSILYTPNPNFNGTDTIVYVISDGNGGTDTATVVITVDPVNDSPLAVNDFVTTNEDATVTVDVQANDTDLDGDTLATTILSGPSNGGAVVINGDSITYTPIPNFNGTDTIVYVISDGNGGTDTAIVVITVDPVNDSPVAVDDFGTSNEDTPVTIDVQTNDSDLDGDTLTTTILSGPSNGAALVVNGDSITYSPNPNFNGTDTIVYVISDGNGGTDTATVVITVDSVNDPPVAVDDSVAVNEDTPITVDVQSNDSDLDGDTVTTTILSGPINGAALVANGDSITYTPNTNFNGTDTIVYVISDGNGGTDTATVVITVDSVNDPPVAVDDSVAMNEDTPITVDVQVNDSDLDGDTLTTTILSGPVNGAALVANGDSITYTPNTNFNGTDTIVYVISDGNGGTDTATVVITVDPVNDPPVAVDDSVAMNEDTPITVDVQANDSDLDGDTLTTTILSGPSNGAALVVNGDSITYTPNPNFNGIDTVVYVISDGNGDTDTAMVVITVDSVNDPPVAVDDSLAMNEDTPITVDVQSNDSDLDGDTLMTTILSGPSNGAVLVVNGDSINYTPNPNFNGTDTIVYVISDGNGGTDTATVVITVDPVNDSPVAVDDSVAMNEDTPITVDVQANDSDLDGDTLTTTILSGPSNGAVLVVNGDSITYTPNPNFNGTDTIVYVISDGNGGTDTATVGITVDPVNDSPVAVDDATTTPEDLPVTYHVQGNDSDVDSDPLTTIVVVNGVNGTAVIVGDSIQYTPNLNYNGNDTITYAVCDGGGLCDTAIFVINVGGMNDLPIAVDDSTITNEDTPATVDVQVNDSDLDGDTLTTTILSGPSNGTAVVVNGDSITYTPDPNFNGTDTIVYVISDGNGGTDTAMVVITVDPVNDPPVAVDDNATTNEDLPVTVDVQSNDSDQDGDALTTSILSGPGNGTAVVVNGDSITYTPDPNFIGTDTIVYVLSDGKGGADTATVVITIDPVNDPPVAVNDSVDTNEDTPITVDIQANDSDLDGDTLTTTIPSGPGNGTAVVLNGDSIIYTPAPNFIGTDTIVYVISDGNGGTDTATVIITVDPVNDPPVAVDDSTITNEDVTVIVDVIVNDFDIDGDTLTTVNIAIGPSNGTAVIVNGDSILYTPNANFNGTDTFIYVIDDGNGSSDSAKVVISVTPINDPPLATNEVAITPEDSSVVINVQLNDVDIDGDTLTTTIMVNPSNGTVSVINGDSLLYTPNPSFSGFDTIIYFICDPFNLCDTAIVYIDIGSVNDAPTAVNDTIELNEDDSLYINVQANDFDIDGDSLLTIIVIQSSYGSSYVVNVDSILYIPNPNFNGPDTITYILCDAFNACDTAMVLINVNPINDPPIANTDSVNTVENGQVLFTNLTNDIDVDNNIDTFSVNIIIGPFNGTSVFDPVTGLVTYNPNSFFVGTDSIFYLLCDLGFPVYCDTGLVIIEVEDVNFTPNAVNDLLNTSEDSPLSGFSVLANDTDSDGDSLFVSTSPVFGPSNGTLLLNPDGTYLYTPNANFNGVDSFAYVVCDNGTPVLCDTGIVTINVSPVNDPPVAVDDSATTIEGNPVVINVPVNDSDVDSNLNVSSVTVITGPSNGTVAVDPSNGNVTYTPNAGFAGTDSFGYLICDNGIPVYCVTALATINVDSVNDPLTAVNDNVIVPEDSAVTFDPLANDTDSDNNIDFATVSISTGPSNGIAVVDTVTGNITYTPNPDFNGLDSLVYGVCDTGSPIYCGSATVYITVSPFNDALVAVDDVVNTTEDNPITANLVTNDLDIDGNIDTSSINLISLPLNGTAYVDPLTGELTYTPNPNFNGVDSVQYVICDTGIPVYCDTATVIINVSPVNNDPVAVDDFASTDPGVPVVVDVQFNDIDLDGDTLTTTIISGPTNGTTGVINGDSVTYTPNITFLNGIDTITYVVCDNGIPQACDTANVYIKVPNTNLPPFAVNDILTVLEDSNGTVDVLLNDFDPNGDSLGVTVIGGPTNGSVINNGDGNLSYNPNPNFNGTDTIVYLACDTASLCDTAIVIINVTPVNDAPIAVMDTVSTIENTPVVLVTASNDSDVDGNLNVTSVTVTSNPLNGTFIVNPVTGIITYSPNANFNGVDSLQYVICDTGIPVLCATAWQIITISPANSPVFAVNDTVTIAMNMIDTIKVLVNDLDPEMDLDTNSLTIVSGPLNGVAIVDPVTNNIIYNPVFGYNGLDSLQYVICDNGSPVYCDTATVSILVGFINLPPAAIMDTSSTDQNIPVSTNLLINDTDPNNNIATISVLSGPSNGIANINPISGLGSYLPNFNFFGLDTVKYVICDGGFPVYCDTSIWVITVLNENDQPIANDDAAITPPNTFTVIDVQFNDSDPDGDPLTTFVIQNPTFGTAAVINGDSVIYTPFVGVNLVVDNFVYVVCDNAIPGLCDTAIVTVTIPMINIPPVASNEQVNILEDYTVVINPLANDYDPNGDSLLPTITGGPSNGTAMLNPDGTITYTPDPNFNGLDTIYYVVCDSTSLCDSAFTVINIIPVNDPPVAVTEYGSGWSGTSIVAPVLNNDTDPEGNIDPTSVTVIGGPSNGTVTVDPLTGNITYIPNLTFSGFDTITYVVCDQGLPVYCDTADVIIFVILSNVPPVVVNDSTTTFEDVPVAISVLNNDSDPDNNIDTTSITMLSGPFNGTATIDTVTGQIIYTPNSNFNGIDSLVYDVCDTGAPVYCESATVYINVVLVNDHPLVIDDTASVNEDNSVVIAVVNNDSDPENNLDTSSVSILTGPSNGIMVVDPVTGNVIYTPNTNFNGTDTIVYQICDTGLPIYCGSATVVITVNPVNDPPIAVDDTVSTNEDNPITFSPLANDIDIEGGIDSSSVTVIGSPNNGTAVVDPITGQITYTPNPNYNGTDTITYIVCDLGLPVLCDTATIVINVASVNNPPVAVNDTVITNEDNPLVITVVNNDFDVDNNIDTLSTTILSGPFNGSVSVDPVTGQIIYVPNPNFNGTDTIVYQICDTGMPIFCGSATVIISVLPVNDSPIAFDDNISTNEGSPVTFNPLINDIDVDGGLDPGSVSIINGPNNGIVSVDPITGQITYTPGSFFNGLDTIVYTVCDSGMPVLCDTATVIINVGSVNNPPIAVDDSDVTNEDTPITIVVLSNDTDIDGNIDPTSIGVIGGPNNGMAIIDPVTGDITYIPNMNFFGVDTFTYMVCDQGSPVYCDSAIVIITILSVNDPPVALNDTIVTQQGNSQSISVDINDFDIDGSIDPTTVVILSGPIGGTATVDPLTGIITYIPNPNFFGIDSIVYLICDNGSPVLCDTATLYIHVLKGDEPNVFVPNAFSPNGDLIYDLWVIDGIENYPNNVLKIYNRWGNVVYEKKGYDNSWNGTSNAGLLVFGKDLPDGTYYYVLDLGEGEKAKAGFVVIKRK